jgi:hypothetical protein
MEKTHIGLSARPVGFTDVFVEHKVRSYLHADVAALNRLPNIVHILRRRLQLSRCAAGDAPIAVCSYTLGKMRFGSRANLARVTAQNPSLQIGQDTIEMRPVHVRDLTVHLDWELSMK